MRDCISSLRICCFANTCLSQVKSKVWPIKPGVISRTVHTCACGLPSTQHVEPAWEWQLRGVHGCFELYRCVDVVYACSTCYASDRSSQDHWYRDVCVSSASGIMLQQPSLIHTSHPIGESSVRPLSQPNYRYVARHGAASWGDRTGATGSLQLPVFRDSLHRKLTRTVWSQPNC